MLKVLMYLFENYIDNDARLISDQKVIGMELMQAGFDPAEIEQAMVWLQGFLQQNVPASPKQIACSTETFRIFSADEAERLNEASRILLMNLEYMGVIDPQIREMVIDRLMALDFDVIEPADVKWVVMIVLFHQNDSKAALNLMQDMVMHGDTVH